uniref:Uncharacterized protein n=1 Tax=Cacopsylla melanoneura TaxID=428564 RepID=A0A8D9B585_9HEMI
MENKKPQNFIKKNIDNIKLLEKNKKSKNISKRENKSLADNTQNTNKKSGLKIMVNNNMQRRGEPKDFIKKNIENIKLFEKNNKRERNKILSDNRQKEDRSKDFIKMNENQIKLIEKNLKKVELKNKIARFNKENKPKKNEVIVDDRKVERLYLDIELQHEGKEEAITFFLDSGATDNFIPTHIFKKMKFNAKLEKLEQYNMMSTYGEENSIKPIGMVYMGVRYKQKSTSAWFIIYNCESSEACIGVGTCVDLDLISRVKENRNFIEENKLMKLRIPRNMFNVRNWTTNIQIGTFSLKFLLDSGAMMNVIPLSIFLRLNLNIELKPAFNALWINEYGGQDHVPMGVVSLKIKHQKKEMYAYFYIFDINDVPILSLSLCLDLDLIRINF